MSPSHYASALARKCILPALGMFEPLLPSGSKARPSGRGEHTKSAGVQIFPTRDLWLVGKCALLEFANSL